MPEEHLRSPSARRIGLYVHVPFCSVKCHYCNFVITLDRTPPQRERFLEALRREVLQAEKQYGRLAFETVYFGGGTPSQLTEDEFTAAVGFLKKSFIWDKVREFTVEINPGDVSPEKVQAFVSAGVNRASVGAQAFQEELLKAMGRPHGAEQIREAVSLLRAGGIENISLDLIFRLPGQTPAIFRESLNQALALAPSQITLYDLEVHEKTRFGILQNQGRLRLPDEGEHFAMFETAVTALEAAGYRHYELLSFARPGGESRHNLLYWENQDYLGLGPGAFRYLNGIRSQFAETVPDYLRRCEASEWEPAVSDRLSPEDIEWENLLTGLRLDRGVTLAYFTRIGEAVRPVLKRLSDAGLTEISQGRAALTFRGRALAETVFSALIQAR